MTRVVAHRCQVGDDGLMILFECPGCGSHHGVTVKAPSDPRQRENRPIWSWNGSVTEPTFSPSVFVNPPGPLHTDSFPICHSFVASGRIRFLPDSTHPLAGTTADLPDWD